MGISAKFQVIFDDSMGEAIIRVEHVGHWVDLGDSIQDLQSFFEHVLEKEVDKNMPDWLKSCWSEFLPGHNSL